MFLQFAWGKETGALKGTVAHCQEEEMVMTATEAEKEVFQTGEEDLEIGITALLATIKETGKEPLTPQGKLLQTGFMPSNQMKSLHLETTVQREEFTQ